MPRGNVRQRSKLRQDSWTVQVYMGRDPDTGKKRYHSEAVLGTKALAERRLTELLQELDRGVLAQSSGLTLGEYLDEWLEGHASLQNKARTVVGYRGVVERYLKPSLGNVPLERVRVRDVEDMEKRLLRRGGAGGKALSETTVRQAHRVLSSALSAAVRLGLVYTNVVKSVSAPKARRYEASTLRWSDLRFLFGFVPDGVMRTVFVLAVFTGLRRSELVGLQWGDIDLQAGQVSVRRALVKRSGVEAELGAPKNGRGRVVTLPEPCVAEVKSHWERSSVRGNSDFVFCKSDGRALNPDTVTRVFKRYCRMAGLGGLRLHDLRHTHASLMLAEGVHLKVVSERLGHSSVGITGDLYSHVAPSVQRDASVRFGVSWELEMGFKSSGELGSVQEC